MQEKSNSGTYEASVEEMVDQHEQQTQAVRLRVFTRWMNLLLQKCDPPLVVHDLLPEVRDGRVLMALLEQLSGCKLLYRFRSSPQRIFRLNNISKVLSFLDDRHVKLSGVDLSGIADGVPTIVLHLIWSIILHFQGKLVVRGLKGHLSPSNSSPKPSQQVEDSSDGGSSSYSRQAVPRKGRKSEVEPKPRDKTIRTLLQLVQTFTSRFGVQVQDFGKSWGSGMAMVALIKSINPALVDLRDSSSRDPRRNIEMAFEIAHRCLDIPPLLESEDLLCTSPDEQCVITYVSMFLRHHSPIEDSVTNSGVPSTESLGPVSLGETHAHDPEAQMLLKGLETSSELLLWKKWSRTPLGASEHSVSSAATSSAGRRRNPVNPPSPLDTGVHSQEIQSWIKEAEQRYRKRKVGSGCLSLSSEEGIYSLSALDSEDEEQEEEEEACSNILELSQQVFSPLDSHTHLDVEETVKSEALEKHENGVIGGCREMVGSTDVFDSQSPNKHQAEECGVVEAPQEDGSSCCWEEVAENARLVTRKDVCDDAIYIKQQSDGKVEVDDLSSEGQEGQGIGFGGNNPVDLTPMTEEKEGNRESMNDGCQVKRRTEVNVNFGDILWSKLCIATDQTLREEGSSLEALVARCDITPLELHTLLALWIAIYCCLILHQMTS